jgi:ribosome-binding factor A
VGAELARTLQQVLARGLHDPRYRGLVSVLEARVSPDLADATIFISVLPEEAGPLTLEALRHATGHLSSRVRRAMALRRMPRLHFRLDDRLKRAASLEQSIRSGLAESAADGEAPPEATSPDHHLGEHRS